MTPVVMAKSKTTMQSMGRMIRLILFIMRSPAALEQRHGSKCCVFGQNVSCNEKETAQLRGDMPVRCAVQCSLMGLCQRPCYSAIRID